MLPDGDGRGSGLPWESSGFAGLLSLMEDQLARLVQSGTGVGGRGGSSALPFDAGARRVLDGLRAALAVAVLELGAGDGWPDDSGDEVEQLGAMARWLLGRLDRLRGHGSAARLSGDIVAAVRRARGLIDQAAVREFVGECEICGGSLFRRARANDGVCQRCGRLVEDAEVRRLDALASAESGLATRDVILSAAPSSYGLVIKDSTFAGWVKRGRLQPRGVAANGVELWRVGEVLDLARERDRKRKR